MATNGQPANPEIVISDLKGSWKTFSGDSFQDYEPDEGGIRAIYFELDPGRYAHHSNLSITSARPFSIYLNHRLLVFNSESVSLDIDSLNALSNSPWLFGIHQQGGLKWLKTEVRTPVQLHSNFHNLPRPADHYLDFSILASLMLIAFFITLLRTNTRLTLDYFNFVRLFSIQEREDTLLNSRISASVNIFYYGLCSLLAGFILLTVFHFGSRQIAFAESFSVQSTLHGFLQWFKLSSLIALALFVKLILIAGFSRLFDFREAPGLQFFNFVRLIFFLSVSSGLVCLCYFVFNIQSTGPYSFLLAVIIFLLNFWVAVIGLKLLRRSSFRFFQLFSYLCASELIPIVILVKVLNS